MGVHENTLPHQTLMEAPRASPPTDTNSLRTLIPAELPRAYPHANEYIPYRAFLSSFMQAVITCGPMVLVSMAIQAIFSFELFVSLPSLKHVVAKRVPLPDFFSHAGHCCLNNDRFTGGCRGNPAVLRQAPLSLVFVRTMPGRVPHLCNQADVSSTCMCVVSEGSSAPSHMLI